MSKIHIAVRKNMDYQLDDDCFFRASQIIIIIIQTQSADTRTTTKNQNKWNESTSYWKKTINRIVYEIIFYQTTMS